ncbi:hypothetical protein NIES267_73570 (plasmid) [Calothrix parasitica NIES-267]|uniref:Peptidase A2 domain-containing protein n=1 Tax=Calothrix parasitica NIES-267 TaxID=1973488 RepID=A0A1Z4M2W2_9CYAN|nr:hypothetical protein NIES267_73570 [Calothrix parasitica NIES-267]
MKHLNLHLAESLLNPTLTLQVQGGGEAKELTAVQIEALVDTGFDDYLSFSYRLAEELGLPVMGQTNVELADGSQYDVQIAKAIVFLPQFQNTQIEINVILGDDEESLIGTRLLKALCHKFSLDFEQNLLMLENVRNYSS